MSATWTRDSWWGCHLSVYQGEYFYTLIVAAGHICPHAVRWLQRNMPWQLGLTTFSDLLIRMHECYLDQGLLVRMPSFSMPRGIFLYFDCRCWPHLPICCEVVTRKFAVNIRVNNIFRPDDPHAWVLPGPGSPGEGRQAAEEELSLKEHFLPGYHQRPPHRPRQAFDKTATKIIKRKPGRRSSLLF